jgi:hypothetical protein
MPIYHVVLAEVPITRSSVAHQLSRNLFLDNIQAGVVHWLDIKIRLYASSMADSLTAAVRQPTS